MAQVVGRLMSDYRNTMEQADPRVEDWPLMSSPFPTAAICLFYLYFVTRLGPRLMKDRKPFQMRPLLLLYNAFQVYFSCWMFKEGLMSGWWGKYSLKCQPVDYSKDPTAMRMANAVWWFYFSKFTELSDTIFFVLRKKNDHVTILHLIHHGGIPMACWFGTKFVPGGHSTLCGMLNTFVHAVMYSYYFISALKPSWKGYLKFKKWVTLLQLAQFVLIILHALQLLVVDCDYPRAFVWFIAFHGALFFVLFSNFYMKTYAGKRAAKKIEDDRKKKEQEQQQSLTSKHNASNGTQHNGVHHNGAANGNGTLSRRVIPNGK